MKKTYIALLALVFAVPVFAAAHGASMMGFSNDYTGPEMMTYIEDQVLGDDLHAEMEGLMEKMIGGELTQTEANRLTTLMQEYPGPYGMMMGRIGMTQGFGGGYGSSHNMMWGGHMGYGYAGGYTLVHWLCALTVFVWLIVGLLAILWFLKKGNLFK